MEAEKGGAGNRVVRLAPPSSDATHPRFLVGHTVGRRRLLHQFVKRLAR
jgi:hypothetical protein